MSLIRQLWLVVVVSMLTAFAGSFVLGMFTARHYLEQQLAVKNADNAASLALSMSQLAKDPVTVELQVAALFDSGQYASVRVLDPDGRAMVEREAAPDAGDVPEWFARLFPIASQPGQAQVSDGWHQFGTVRLVSHSRFAYKELWDGGIDLLLWFASGGLALGFVGTLWLARIRRPLDAVVGQAQAIGERRFISIEAPRTPELRSLAGAMNAMVERLKAMFAEEAARLEEVRREANHDALTGLANRSYFMNLLHLALDSDDAPPSGTLLILRLADLAGINRRLGREGADEVLRRAGQVVADIARRHPGSIAARLNGADFALLLPGQETAAATADEILGGVRGLAAAGLLAGERLGHVGVGTYRHGSNPGLLLAGIDGALAAAESQGGAAWAAAETMAESGAASAADWRHILRDAVQSRRLRLVEFPVIDGNGQLLHQECPLRLQLAGHDEWLTAGSFMPMAARLSMSSELDLAAVDLALDRLANGLQAAAVNLSGESLLAEAFLPRLEALLASRRAAAARLWLEIAEIGACEHFAAFRDLGAVLRPFGCRLGIEHFGHRFSEIGRFHAVGLDYLKVDGGFIRGIDQHSGNQAFLKGLCNIAHSIGLHVIAEGVLTAGELAMLPGLGFDGATGPAVTAQA